MKVIPETRGAALDIYVFIFFLIQETHSPYSYNNNIHVLPMKGNKMKSLNIS